MNENIELSLPKKSRIIPNIADSAKSIGITFSTISNNLYRLLSGNLSTFLVSGTARLVSCSWSRRLRSFFQNFIKESFCFVFLCHKVSDELLSVIVCHFYLLSEIQGIHLGYAEKYDTKCAIPNETSLWLSVQPNVLQVDYHLSCFRSKVKNYQQTPL